MDMSCDDYRAAMSARADGEPTGVGTDLLETHLDSCPACRDFESRMTSLNRRTRIRVADEPPDLSTAVVRRTAAADRASAAWMARWLLLLVAAQIIVLALPDLLAIGEDAHSERHIGAFGLAYAVGLIVVVARPARARTMLNVAMVLAGALVVTAVVDVAQGRVPLVNEAVHIPELFSVLFLWLLARPHIAANPPSWMGPLRRADPAPDPVELDDGDTVVRPLRRRSHDT